MNNLPSLKDFGALRRKTVSVSEEALVRTRPLLADRPMPVLVEPSVPGMDLAAWAHSNRRQVDELLLAHRALLFRGFGVRTVDEFQGFVEASSDGERLEYRDRSSPRHEVGEQVYTSTDYPSDQRIFLHNEGTYWVTWPLKIYFCCLKAPERGGETPIADTCRIYQRVDPAVRQRFAERKVLYVRNYNDGFGLRWQNAFQTDDPAEVDRYCRDKGIETEWKGGDRLRTRQVRDAVAVNPRTGEPAWFNHATFFHVSTLDPQVRESLLAEFPEEDLPYNTYYGDGTPIEAEVLDDLRRLYQEETIVFPWQEGDVLMLDNMAVAHARQPYAGERLVVVGMAEPCSREESDAAARGLGLETVGSAR
ncbi:MAG TPA: TauD/TfdA family dioxygenase [Thermoanaerobaculia bacterium]|nr:TauD/TfdA family dioxygenase [Thermoanaerobaculia bacterium]